METTNTIYITSPAKELVDFIEETQQRKRDRMRTMRDNFLRTQS